MTRLSEMIKTTKDHLQRNYFERFVQCLSNTIGQVNEHGFVLATLAAEEEEVFTAVHQAWMDWRSEAWNIDAV